MTNKEADALAKWDREHLVHPMCPIGENAGRIISTGKGVTIQDAEGKEYIDGLSQLICVNLGYGRKEIIEAMKAQMDKIPYHHQFFGVSDAATIKCAQKLAELTPKGLDHFYFTSGGSESIEVALRYARLYWHNKGTSKYKIISLYDSYHGITFGAMSAVGLGKGFFSKGVHPLVPGFLHIPSYNCYHCAFGKEYPGCDMQCAKFLAYTIEREDPETVAAFIAEPVQGTAGMIAPPPEFWPMVRKICTDNNVLLITDEVMTGFCRTGKMFAVQHWGVKPDLMAMAKGLTSAYFPFGGVAFSGEVYKALKGSMVMGYTYSGHPTGAAAALKTMEIYVKEKIAEHAAKVGKHIFDRLNREFMALPHVGNVTGLGLMIGIEIVADKATRKSFDPSVDVATKIPAEALKAGLSIRAIPSVAAAGDTVQFCPPLIITTKQADKALDILYPILANLKT